MPGTPKPNGASKGPVGICWNVEVFHHLPSDVNFFIENRADGVGEVKRGPLMFGHAAGFVIFFPSVKFPAARAEPAIRWDQSTPPLSAMASFKSRMMMSCRRFRGLIVPQGQPEWALYKTDS
jgi:hypothetical protein